MITMLSVRLVISLKWTVQVIVIEVFVFSVKHGRQVLNITGMIPRLFFRLPLEGEDCFYRSML